MSVFRMPKRSNVTVMSNVHLREVGLSLKEKGLLSYMLSNSDGWAYRLRGLVRFSSDAINSIPSGLNELMRHEYLVRVKVRDAKGRIVGCDYQIFEVPQKDLSPKPENP